MALPSRLPLPANALAVPLPVCAIPPELFTVSVVAVEAVAVKAPSLLPLLKPAISNVYPAKALLAPPVIVPVYVVFPELAFAAALRVKPPVPPGAPTVTDVSPLTVAVSWIVWPTPIVVGVPDTESVSALAMTLIGEGETVTVVPGNVLSPEYVAVMVCAPALNTGMFANST